MPAAGKCRKGVFRMKKLLLVMLVPVLVLGVMSCGTKVPDGSPSPVGLQGKWVTPSVVSPDLIIAGNQVTFLLKASDGSYTGNIALRTHYEGEKGDNDSGIFITGATDSKLTFNWFDEPYKQIGSITFDIISNANIAEFIDDYDGDVTTISAFMVTGVKYETYYQNVMLPEVGAAYLLDEWVEDGMFE
jgi:hypothetical protein